MTIIEPEERREPTASVSALRSRGVVRRFARGHALMHEGQIADRVLVLTTGYVKIVSTTASGREVLIGLCGPGELLGELSLLDDRPRSATVLALEPVEAVVLSREAFRSVLTELPEAAPWLLQVLARRLRDSDTAHVQLAALTTLERVGLRLLELADRFGRRDCGVIRITLPLSQEELASWSASSVESASRALRTMRSLGWIETRRREIVIRAPDSLRRSCASAVGASPT